MTAPATLLADSDVVTWHFLNWARMSRRGGRVSGYPNKACGCTSWGDAWDDDSKQDRHDTQCAEAVQAILEGLPAAVQAAVNRCYLDAVYRFPRDNYQEMLDLAREEVRRGLGRKGLL